MALIMTRNAKGKATLGSGESYKVPRDRSALSVLCDNRIQHGDDFRSDGWVYRKGKPVRKWFTKMYDGGEGFLMWEPKLNDLRMLETKRWKAIEYAQKFYNDVWRPAFEALWKVKKAHAQVTHPYTGDKIPPWWLYQAEDSGRGPCFHYDWVDTPKKKLNLAVGNRMYAAERRNEEVGQRVSIFRIAFQRALDKFLDQQSKPTIPSQTGRLIINDRIYWLITECNQFGVVYWKLLAAPEGQIIDLTLA